MYSMRYWLAMIVSNMYDEIITKAIIYDMLNSRQYPVLGKSRETE